MWLWKETQDACRVEGDAQTRKCLLELEHRLPPTAGKAHVRAWGLDNAVERCVMNPHCRTVIHSRQSDMVYKGLTRCTEKASGSQIIQPNPARQIDTISQYEEDVQDRKAGASTTHQQHVPSTHTCLCHRCTLRTGNSVQALRLQEAEECCTYTRNGEGIGDPQPRSMLSPATWREKAVCRLWDCFGALSPPFSSLVPATSSVPPFYHPSFLCAPSCSSPILLPAAFQLMTPCKQPINHPCTHISLGLGEREFIPLAQLSERPPAARSDQRALNSWQGVWGLQ